jgi:hypothetical protein
LANSLRQQAARISYLFVRLIHDIEKKIYSRRTNGPSDDVKHGDYLG